MPLLPAEPSLFPDDLFCRLDSGLAAPLSWLVIYTRARAEKALARSLLRSRIGFYLPLYERRWRSGHGRTRVAHLPLFPGYVFVHGDAEARLAALETGLVSRCIPVVDQAGLHVDLSRVHRLTSAGLPLTPEEPLPEGTRVEFVTGPFTGLEGKILQRGKQVRLLVEVELLQRGVSVEIDSSMVRPLSRPDLAGCASAAPRS